MTSSQAFHSNIKAYDFCVYYLCQLAGTAKEKTSCDNDFINRYPQLPESLRESTNLFNALEAKIRLETDKKYLRRENMIIRYFLTSEAVPIQHDRQISLTETFYINEDSLVQELVCNFNLISRTNVELD